MCTWWGFLLPCFVSSRHSSGREALALSCLGKKRGWGETVIWVLVSQGIALAQSRLLNDDKIHGAHAP